MKYIAKLLAAGLAVLMVLGLCGGAFAATGETAVIDTERTGSIHLYKYDLTNAEADGVWDSSYVSTGVADEGGVNAVLGNPAKVNDLGNGEVSYGYAMKGVEFTYLWLGNITTFHHSVENEDGTRGLESQVLYYLTQNDRTTAFLTAIGLDYDDCVPGAAIIHRGNRPSRYGFASQTLSTALSNALATNATAVKNALEVLVKDNGTAMPETDSYGHTEAAELPLGLYLLVETRVPEAVTTTTNPFLLSVPMTSVNGTNAANGGEEWRYDITVYPKNATGNPTLEKTVREAAKDSGKNNGSAAVDDGYRHTATASAGDAVEYQIRSKLPNITSAASFLTEYTFVDTLSKGIAYNKDDVRIEIFSDEACTERLAAWTQTDETPKFTVAYSDGENGAAVMTVSMTQEGLTELNTSTALSAPGMVSAGYANCYLRITYAATLRSDAATVMGDSANPNEVTLTWKRTSSDYYDTLRDDCHVYAYALELTKQFSDEDGNFANVEFVLRNETDGYYVVGQRLEENGVYYVTGRAVQEADATRFVPDSGGKIIIKGLEDDAYLLTEVKTDDGYVLLESGIPVEIMTADGAPCGVCGKALLTASAQVSGREVMMAEDGGSVQAVVPLTVVNTHGFDLPETGDNGTMLYTIGGIALLALAGGCIVVIFLPKKKTKRS